MYLSFGFLQKPLNLSSLDWFLIITLLSQSEKRNGCHRYVYNSFLTSHHSSAASAHSIATA